MPRKQPRPYRKQPRRYRAAPPQQFRMQRMEGVLVDTARLSLGVGVLGAIVNTSQGMWGNKP